MSWIVSLLTAFAGTVVGNLARHSLIAWREGELSGPDVFEREGGEIVVSGVLTHTALAWMGSLFSGPQRPLNAFLSGALLTMLFGDQLDRALLPQVPEVPINLNQVATRVGTMAEQAAGLAERAANAIEANSPQA